MTAPVPYVLFPGNAREALTRYAEVFGGEVMLVTNQQMNRPDGRPDAIGHGQVDGPVGLFAADADDDRAPRMEGVMLALLGTAAPDVMRGWFTSLSEGGTVIDELQVRPWGDWDGQVTDRFGLTWLIGFHPEEGVGL